MYQQNGHRTQYLIDEKPPTKKIVRGTIELVFPGKSVLSEIENLFDSPDIFPWMDTDNQFKMSRAELKALPDRFEYLGSRIKMVHGATNNLAGTKREDRINALNVLRFNAPTRLLFVVRDPRSKCLVGTIVLEKISLIHQTASVRTIIKPEFHGKTFGTQAKCCILELAFQKLGLLRVESETLDNNQATLAINHNLGFKIEGRARHRAQVMGTWRDLIHMAILKEEWLEHLTSAYHHTHCMGLHSHT